MASAQELLQEQSDLPAAQPGEGPKKKGRIKFPKLKKKPPVKRLIALALAAGAVYWMFLRPGGEGPDIQTSYTAAPVTMRDIVVSVSGTGTVTPADSYKVGALVTGEILEAPFAEGDRVEKGALLYRVDPGAAQTALDQAQLNLRQAQLAYHDLAFDDQMYEEDVTDPQYIRHYISDLCDFQTIFQTTQQQVKSFFFNVTMQNHSGYAQGWNNLERTISLPDSLKLADSNAEQYFALARQTDNALRELIGYYSRCDEPTMIVFFGDHQPPLKNAFYERLYGKSLDQRTTEEVMQQYAVPFFIWTNYDLSGAEELQTEDVVISPNYLGVLTAKLAGLPLTGYMNFLDQMYAELPVVTPVGFVSKDGVFLSKKELSDRQQDWLDQYAILNYCGMVDLFDQARPMFCMDEN